MPGYVPDLQAILLDEFVFATSHGYNCSACLSSACHKSPQCTPDSLMLSSHQVPCVDCQHAVEVNETWSPCHHAKSYGKGIGKLPKPLSLDPPNEAVLICPSPLLAWRTSIVFSPPSLTPCKSNIFCNCKYSNAATHSDTVLKVVHVNIEVCGLGHSTRRHFTATWRSNS